MSRTIEVITAHMAPEIDSEFADQNLRELSHSVRNSRIASLTAKNTNKQNTNMKTRHRIEITWVVLDGPCRILKSKFHREGARP